MILSVHQPQYIPWLGYFDKIAKSDGFVFLNEVQYKDREFQNRNKIRTSAGWIWLTVPVVTKGLGRQKISEVRIDNSSAWQRKHGQSLKAGYGKTAFFERYFPFFEYIYKTRFESLAHLNTEIIKYILGELGLSRKLYQDTDLDIRSQRTDRIVEICRKLKADTYFSGSGGRQYLEEDKFSGSGIELRYQEFTHPIYNQQFSAQNKGFLPYMSIIDLLFNEGPNSKCILNIS
ncbi:MAG: WbqC family protein [Candidatus Omnitrophota bacterium]|jgi:hypothetical protein